MAKEKEFLLIIVVVFVLKISLSTLTNVVFPLLDWLSLLVIAKVFVIRMHMIHVTKDPSKPHRRAIVKLALGGRGRGDSIYPWVGRCGAAPYTLTLFKTNIADFPTLFKGRFTRYDFVACDKFTTDLRYELIQLSYDCSVRQKNCCRILKHVLKRCDNHSRNLQNIRIV